MNYRNIINLFLAMVVIPVVQTCTPMEDTRFKQEITQTYLFNLSFLRKHTTVIELRNDLGRLILAPEWQGRVMTSTMAGKDDHSFGWINHNLISKGEILEHMNPYGGEERFWLGPEGGQFSLFFKQDDSFEFENWQTPAILDTDPFEVVDQDSISVTFVKEAQITNYSGTLLNFKMNRKVKLLDSGEVKNLLGFETDELKVVGYRSDNVLTNTGKKGWNPNEGMPSIWMLGMYNPTPRTVVVIPVKEGKNSALGKKVNDNYFGKIGKERLLVKDNHIFFKADGKSRGKIGINPRRTDGVMGSYDPSINSLTLLFCEIPSGATEFVNSAWELQDSPLSGDAYNSYNDGPLEDGSIMGPFYELETSSPALALEPGESYNHSQVTLHIIGSLEQLDMISKKILKVSLEEIESVF